MNELVLVNVRIDNEQMITDSRNVADVFNKRHDHVLRDIEAMRKDVPNFGEMFFEGTMPDAYGREQKVFFMNRDGFSLLAMGFTGTDAMKWKLKYINAFNELESFYNTPEQVMARALRLADKTIASLNQRVIEQDKRIMIQDSVINEMKPKVSYYDMILDNKSTVLVTQIAQDYGMSAKGFNKMLKDMGVQHKVGGQWILYSRYQGNGYVHSKTFDFERSNGIKDVNMNTEWTQKGRLFLYDFLKKHNILPLIEREI